MAKVTGLGWTTLTVADSGGTPRDIRNDLTSLDFATPRGVQEVTGIDKSAIERLLLLADFSITMNGVFDPGANLAHAVFKTIPSTSVNRATSIVVSSQTLNNTVVLTDYTVKRTDKGELNFVVPGVLADGTVPTWS